MSKRSVDIFLDDFAVKKIKNGKAVIVDFPGITVKIRILRETKGVWKSPEIQNIEEFNKIIINNKSSNKEEKKCEQKKTE